MRLTPLEFSYLVKRHHQEHERQEFLLGILNKNVVNFSMVRPKDYTPQITDFMPSRWGRDDESEDDAIMRLNNIILSPEAISRGAVVVH